MSVPKDLMHCLRHPPELLISNGTIKSGCGNLCRSMFGCERSVAECPCTSLFQANTVDPPGPSESHEETASRILDAVEWHRLDLNQIRCILPSSPSEGLDIKEKLGVCDTLSERLMEIEANQNLWKTYRETKTKHDHLHDLLPQLAADADRARRDKAEKERQIRRKELRIEVLQEEASEREDRRSRRMEASRRGRRSRRDDCDDSSSQHTEQLLPSVPRGRAIRAIRQVEIPSLQAEVNELKADIKEAAQVIREHDEKKAEFHPLHAYVMNKEPPYMDTKDEEDTRSRLSYARHYFAQHYPRVYDHLFGDKKAVYKNYRKDFQQFFESIDSGMCPCGVELAAHCVLLSPFPLKSASMEERLTQYARRNVGSDIDDMDYCRGGEDAVQQAGVAPLEPAECEPFVVAEIVQS